MDYLQTLEELQNYYSNLLIIQYNGKPKAKATIELITRLVYSNMALLQIRDAFNWKTAKEAQLDIIGKWVGVDKAYTKNNTWSNTYLSYPAYGSESAAELDVQQGGYSDYTTFDTLEGGVLTYKDIQSNKQQLDPEQFRTVIGLKIIKNNIVHNQGNIDEAIWEYFGGKNLYSKYALASEVQLYSDKNCATLYGEVYEIDGTKITVAKGTEIAKDWTLQAPINISKGANAIEYFNGKYFVLFNSGKLAFSTDLQNWTTVDTGRSDNLISILYVNSSYFLYTSEGYYATSVDGETWTPFRKMKNGVINSCHGVVYGNNKFVASVNNSNTGQISTSEDGETWSDLIMVDSSAYLYNTIFFLNGLFFCFGYYSRYSVSSDGENWQRIQISGNIRLQTFNSVTFGNGIYMALSISGMVIKSTDGLNWEIANEKVYTGSESLGQITFGENVFVINPHLPLSNQLSYIYVSTDGKNWEKTTTLNMYAFLNTYKNKKFITVGLNEDRTENKLATSTLRYDSLETFNMSNSYTEGNVYMNCLGNVYTTWQPHELTYNYPISMAEIMNVCYYKGVLPAPTGVSIRLLSY